MPLNPQSLLASLKKVRSTGPGAWLACCPSHEDRSPSLSVRITQEGVVLLHCFAGCDVEEVAGAMGVDLTDLFPEDIQRDMVGPVKNPVPARDILLALLDEVMVLEMVLHDREWAKPLSLTDIERAQTAVERIKAIRSMIHGG